MHPRVFNHNRPWRLISAAVEKVYNSWMKKHGVSEDTLTRKQFDRFARWFDKTYPDAWICFRYNDPYEHLYANTNATGDTYDVSNIHTSVA